MENRRKMNKNGANHGLVGLCRRSGQNWARSKSGLSRIDITWPNQTGCVGAAPREEDVVGQWRSW